LRVWLVLLIDRSLQIRRGRPEPSRRANTSQVSYIFLLLVDPRLRLIVAAQASASSVRPSEGNWSAKGPHFPVCDKVQWTAIAAAVRPDLLALVVPTALMCTRQSAESCP
jgi:hypothetical protein